MAVIKNAKISWVKCAQDKPDMGYDGDKPTWKIQIDDPSDELVKKWKADKLGGLKTDDDGKVYIVIARKANPYSNGDPKEAPSVVNKSLKTIDPETVGNGTIANVQYSVYDWEFKKKSGKAADLSGIQVLDLVVREGSVSEFEMVDDDASDAPISTGAMVDDEDMY